MMLAFTSITTIPILVETLIPVLLSPATLEAPQAWKPNRVATRTDFLLQEALGFWVLGLGFRV